MSYQDCGRHARFWLTALARAVRARCILSGTTSCACIATRPQIRNTRQARGKHTLKRKGPGDLSLRPFLGALLHALDSVVAGVVHLGCARPRRVQRKSWLIACEGLRAIEEAFGRYGATSRCTKKAFSGIKTSFCFCRLLGGVREYPGR